jgi:hypothetical protein
VTDKFDDTCVSCKKEYKFQPETVLYLYLGYLKATNVDATCPHCKFEQRIFLARASIVRYADHKSIKVVIYDDPLPEIAERADKVWERYAQAKELPELPRDIARDLYDTFREFGGES